MCRSIACGTPLERIAQRRAALIGWTSSPYRLSELMQSVLRTQGRFDGKALAISIHDGTEENAAQLLYSQRIAIGIGRNSPHAIAARGHGAWQALALRSSAVTRPGELPSPAPSRSRAAP
jgi:hypothetical protein